MSNALTKPARRAAFPTSGRDMAMLKAAPLGGFAVPRLHVEPRHADGGLRVLDRPSGLHVLIYTPSHVGQFRAGHRAGRWYVRTPTHVGGEPQSREFRTAREAVEAVGRGAWTARPPKAAAPRPAFRLRVFWGDDGAAAG